MAYPEQNTEYPLANMPRMGRRNAVAYINRISYGDDDGAFSPMNLLHRSSLSDIDPDGFIARELQLQKRSKTRNDQKSKVAIPSGSVYDGWNRLNDATMTKSGVINEIEQLLEPHGTLKASLSVVKSMPQRLLSENFVPRDETDIASLNQQAQGKPVIPWRKQGVKQTTLADERKKMFESFDMTSFEPPETPHVSESALRKGPKKSKKRTEKALGASTSPGKIKDFKDPYFNVQPKVNTKWNKVGPQQAILNQDATEDTEKDNKLRRLVSDAEKLSHRAKNNHIRPMPAFPEKRQMPTSDNRSKLVTNYPATETVKNTTDQLPLTIAPRFNYRKTLGLANNPNNFKDRTVDGLSQTALYGVMPAHQRGKQESLASSKPTGHSMKSMFLNLQRINNGSVNKRINSTDKLQVGRFSATILGTPVIMKKPTPPLTTIQAPPSPFLLSKISIQSQVVEIPVNGEKIKAGTSKWNKKEPRGETRTGKITLHKANATVKPTYNTVPIKTSPLLPIPKVALQPAKPIQPLPLQTKVIPSIGSLPNKYNNIYIGPYSGSDSDGDHHSPSKR